MSVVHFIYMEQDDEEKMLKTLKFERRDSVCQVLLVN